MVYKDYDEDRKVHDIYDNPGSLQGNRLGPNSASPRSLCKQSVSASRVDRLR